MIAGPELDKLVAEKVMGWEICGDKWKGFPNTVGNARPTIHARNWCPSTNIAHAWDVVEFMRLSLKQWQFHLFQQASSETGEWVGPWGAYFNEPSDVHNDSLYGHGTAPYAICIAALKAVGDAK